MVRNQKEAVPLSHYREQWAQLDPLEMQERLKTLHWNGEECYVNLLGREYAISHPEGIFRPLDGGEEPGAQTQTFLLRYLLYGQEVPWLGGFKTFRELPWGDVYLAPFAGRVLNRAAFTFGSRIGDFRTAAEKLGGNALPQGDAGYEFAFLGACKLRLLLWEGDEEFPPSGQILYSDNFAAGFTAEDRVVAAELLIDAIRNQL